MSGLKTTRRARNKSIGTDINPIGQQKRHFLEGIPKFAKEKRIKIFARKTERQVTACARLNFYKEKSFPKTVRKSYS